MKEETITAVVSLAALSCPGAMAGGDVSRAGEFTHYRNRTGGTEKVYRHKHARTRARIYFFLCRQKAQSGTLAHRADKDPFSATRSNSNELFVFVDQKEQRKKHFYDCSMPFNTKHSKSYVFDFKSEAI